MTGSENAAAEEGKKFCGSMYEITITPKSGEKDIKGKIDLKITGSKSDVDTPFQGSVSILDFYQVLCG